MTLHKILGFVILFYVLDFKNIKLNKKKQASS